MIWFTSDTHYNHKNIVRGCSEWKTFEEGSSHQNTRDFDTLEDHNNTLIRTINRYVKYGDTLYHLGDVSFGGFNSLGAFINQLECRDIRLIFGNHDHHIEKNREGCQNLFTSCKYYDEITMNGRKVVLLHYGLRVWNKSHHGAYHLYGHSPDTLPGQGKSMDVGVDVAFRMFGEYRPFSWTEINQMLSKKETEVVDHHNSNTN